MSNMKAFASRVPAMARSRLRSSGTQQPFLDGSPLIHGHGGAVGGLVWINFDRNALLNLFYNARGTFVADADEIRPQYQPSDNAPSAIFQSSLVRDVGPSIGATIRQDRSARPALSVLSHQKLHARAGGHRRSQFRSRSKPRRSSPRGQASLVVEQDRAGGGWEEQDSIAGDGFFRKMSVYGWQGRKDSIGSEWYGIAPSSPAAACRRTPTESKIYKNTWLNLSQNLRSTRVTLPGFRRF